MKPQRLPRSGFTLLEMMVVMAILVVVLLLMTVTIVGSLRTQQLEVRTANHLTARNALADRFRADVAIAAAAPETYQQVRASDTCLILRMDDSRHVVYRWREGRLERSEGKGDPGPLQVFSVGDEGTVVEFGRSAAGQVLSLRLIDRPKRGGTQQVSEFAAALGGDLQ